ncbi:BREX-1 system adenine-specific DNA-methyltransferase PglX, partial [Halomonas sp. AOP42-D1-22]
GSGHILVEAYNVLKAIYEERGYRTRDIPKLILENNLFGLDIDDRAAQLAGFALLMKAREDDRRILTRNVRLNVLAMQSSQHLDANTLWRDLNLTGDWHQGQSQSLFDNEQKELSSNDTTYKLIADLIERFQDAKTFGSLIEVPNEWEAPLKALLEVLSELTNSGDMMQKAAAQRLVPIVQQAWVLAQRYEAVVANPPYMGSKYQTPVVKKYLKDAYKGYEKDLFSAYIVRNLDFAKEHGQLGFMTPFVWMFISSYEQLRKRLIEEDVITSLIQLEYSGFDGATVPICTFTLSKGHIDSYRGSYIRLSDFRGSANQGPKTLEAIQNRDCGWFYDAKPDDFKKIPGSPVAYWASEKTVDAYVKGTSLDEIAPVRVGLQTGNNEKFVRFWAEVSIDKTGFYINSREEAGKSSKKWFPYNKGGDFRKWYGNNEFLVNWESDGEVIRNFKDSSGILRSRPQNIEFYFKKSITWSFVSSAYFGVRYSDVGAVFDVGGSSAFPDEDDAFWLTGFLCSKQAFDFMRVMNPTLNFQVGNVSALPVLESAIAPIKKELSDLSFRLVELHKKDWNNFEESWGFEVNPLADTKMKILSNIYNELMLDYEGEIEETIRLERKVNQLLINAYRREGITSPDLPRKQATLSVNPLYRYNSEEEDGLSQRFKSDTLSELVSYAIGCMMGRYSLDKPGLILASQGETVRDYLAQIPEPSFAPDNNAIIPLTDQEWFPDDATNRFRDFVRTVWGEEHLQENLDFVAESLCLHAIKPKKGEAALETIRRYLSTQFFKDHLRTYKKRPIYWLFSSGKQKAFECLVYLHRYNESTLAEMRTDYVIPLTTKLASYVEKLEQDKDASTSAAEAKAIDKELSKLYKQQAELNTFDEKLRHYADQRISLDLDDGVKVNYGKFGDLLAEVKAVTGQK